MISRYVVVPIEPQLKQQLLQEFHATFVGGHTSTLRTYIRLAHQFYQLGMRKNVHDFVHYYDIYQQAKQVNTHPRRLLLPFPSTSLGRYIHGFHHRDVFFKGFLSGLCSYWSPFKIW